MRRRAVGWGRWCAARSGCWRAWGRACRNRRWGAAGLPLPCPLGQLGKALATVARMQRADRIGLTFDIVAAHHLPDVRRASAQEIQQPVAVIGAERFDQILGHHPHAGIDEAHIAPRAAETDLRRFDHRRGNPLFCQVQRGREPGIASADHRHICLRGTVQRLGRGRRWRAFLRPG